MRRYDNYDYEEAFKKYIDDTEEERLEKLLKEGKVPLWLTSPVT